MKKWHRGRKGGITRRTLAAALALVLCLTGLTVFPSTAEENSQTKSSDGLCKHHTAHTAECGYQAPSADSKGSPCTYNCQLCEEAEEDQENQDTVKKAESDGTNEDLKEDTLQEKEESEDSDTDTEDKEKYQSDELSIEDVMKLSQEGKLTKSVIEDELGGTIYDGDETDAENAGQARKARAVASNVDKGTIPLGYFSFQCDSTQDPNQQDLSSQVQAELYKEGKTAISPGRITSVIPDPLNANDHKHILTKATVTPKIDGQDGKPVDVFFVGTLVINGTFYVYYITDEVPDEMTVYSVLEPQSENDKNAKKIKVEYEHVIAYDLQYEIQDGGKGNQKVDAIPALEAGVADFDEDKVFGEDRPIIAEQASDTNPNASYIIDVEIPRGYTAEILAYNLNQNEQETGEPQLVGKLGEMLEYADDPVDNVIVPADGKENQEFKLKDDFTVEGVQADQKIVVRYKKIESFTFTANAWLKTRYANGSTPDNWTETRTDSEGKLIGVPDANDALNSFKDNRVGGEQEIDGWKEQPYAHPSRNPQDPWDYTSYVLDFSGVIESDHTYTWKFVGRTTNNDANPYTTWALDALAINGETIKVPIVNSNANKSANKTAEETTILSTGTVVKISVHYTADGLPDSQDDSVIYVDGGNRTSYSPRRIYTVEISNCFENLTVTSGNMVAHDHQELVMSGIHGIKDNQVEAYSSAKTDGNAPTYTWDKITLGGLINQVQTYEKGMPIRFQRATGYYEPDIKVKLKDGTTYENDEPGLDGVSAIQYLRLRTEAGFKEVEDENGNRYIQDENDQEVLLTTDKDNPPGGETADEGKVFYEVEDVFEEVSHAEIHKRPATEEEKEGGLSDEDGFIIPPSSETLATEHYHYFCITEEFWSKMESNSLYKQLRLDVSAGYLKGAIQYLDGADEDGTNGPTNVTNMPYETTGHLDNGGPNGYNNENNSYVSIANTTPVGNAGWVFLHWDLMEVDSTTGEVLRKHEYNGQLVTFRPGSSEHITSLLEEQKYENCFHYPKDLNDENARTTIYLQAHWQQAEPGDPVTYTVNYFIDGQQLHGCNHTADLNTTLAINIYDGDSDNFTPTIIDILKKNDLGVDYTADGTQIDLDKVTVSGDTASGQPSEIDKETIKSGNGVVVGTLSTDNNIINIYLVTKYPTVDIQVTKQWEGTSLTSVNVQLQRRLPGEEGWTSIGDPVALTASTNWSHTFAQYPVYKDSASTGDENTTYEYRVVELDEQNQIIEDGGDYTIRTNPLQSYEVEYKSTKPENLGDMNETVVWENTITNSHKPSLNISKQVEGTYASREQDFNFTVTLTGAGIGQTNTYNARKMTADGLQPVEPLTFTSGVANVTLKDGESIQIMGLPIGAGYTVEETAVSGYTPAYIVGDSDSTATPAAGNLENAPVAVKVINTRSGVPDTGISDMRTRGLLAAGIILFAGFGGSALLRYKMTGRRRRSRRGR